MPHTPEDLRIAKALGVMNPSLDYSSMSIEWCSRYVSDPTPDSEAEVLKWVQANLRGDGLLAFAVMLNRRFFSHWPADAPGDELYMPCWYAVGDYARALLAILPEPA